MGKRDETAAQRTIAARAREHLRSNVVGYLALFVALSGSAYAASQIGTSQIKNNAVTYPKLACKGNSAQDRMVRAGAVCIDKYENSIWTKRTGGTQITGAIPCDPNGQNCRGKIFARSVKGVAPRGAINWFQAQAALANAGKRLPQNAEWQQAVQGTPDGAPCHVDNSPSGPMSTGAAGCTSAWGADDMVGNLWEWVADWVPASAECTSWGSFSDDAMCLSGTSITTEGPGVLIRGGGWSDESGAGPFAVDGVNRPLDGHPSVGFRGAR